MLDDESHVDSIDLSEHGGMIINLVTAEGKVFEGCYIDSGPYREMSPAELEDAIQKITRRRLAEKVISGVKLSISEKQEIYRLLTGNEPPSSKRGRPSECERDKELAFDYLTEKANGKRKAHKIRDDLCEKHNLRKLSGKTRENTFYTALNRGIKILQSEAIRNIKQQQTGNVSAIYIKLASLFRELDIANCFSCLLCDPERILTLIAEYKKEEENPKKIGKNKITSKKSSTF